MKKIPLSSEASSFAHYREFPSPPRASEAPDAIVLHS